MTELRKIDSPEPFQYSIENRELLIETFNRLSNIIRKLSENDVVVDARIFGVEKDIADLVEDLRVVKNDVHNLQISDAVSRNQMQDRKATLDKTNGFYIAVALIIVSTLVDLFVKFIIN